MKKDYLVGGPQVHQALGREPRRHLSACPVPGEDVVVQHEPLLAVHVRGAAQHAVALLVQIACIQ